MKFFPTFPVHANDFNYIWILVYLPFRDWPKSTKTFYMNFGSRIIFSIKPILNGTNTGIYLTN